MPYLASLRIGRPLFVETLQYVAEVFQLRGQKQVDSENCSYPFDGIGEQNQNRVHVSDVFKDAHYPLRR